MKPKLFSLIFAYLSVFTTAILITSCSSGGEKANASIAPLGNWSTKQLPTINNQILYITDIGAYNKRLAISGVNDMESPIIYICNLNNSTCSNESVMTLSPTLTKVTAIEYDESGNLYAILTETTNSFLFSSSTNSLFFMQSSNGWNKIKTLDGNYTSLQIPYKNQIISAGYREIIYGILDYGDVYFSSIESSPITNYYSPYLSAAVQDSYGNLFVGGQELITTDDHAAYFNVWQYQPQSENNFQLIPQLPKLTSLKSMVNDNYGNIYIAGGDNSYADHVWIYNNHSSIVKDIQFNGYLIQQMIYSQQGYLFVIGLDNNYQPQVFCYNQTQRQWAALNFPADPENLTSISQDPISNVLYISGNDNQSVAQVWAFTPLN